MVDIGVAVFFAFECQDKAVGEAFVFVFFADIGAPFIGDDFGNLAL